MQPETELLISMKNEDDSSYLQTSDQPSQKLFPFGDEICNYDKVKVHEEMFLSHHEDTEISTQFVNCLAEAWKETSFDQQQEVITEFLLCLQPEDVSQTNPLDGDSTLHGDETKTPLDEDAPTKFLVEEKKYEVDF